MDTRMLLAGALLILLSIQFYVVTSSQQEPETSQNSVYNMTQREIPRNLPWYYLIVFGDNRPPDTGSTMQPEVFHELLEEAEVIHPYAVIGTGDHVGEGSIEQLEELRELLLSTGLENIWLAIGNHDTYRQKLDAWQKLIAPLNYNIDILPGWRIAILDDETGSTEYWSKQLNNTLTGIGNRSLILVFHKPLTPNVYHNLDTMRALALREFMEKQNNTVKLVLQGHWHGYAEAHEYNATWIITGGAGAPLYEFNPPPNMQAKIVTGVNHYVILTLYPNGQYSITPIRLGDGVSINTSLTISNNTYLNITGIVFHNATDIWGNKTLIPVRINLTRNGDSFIVLTSETGEKTWFTLLENESTIKIESNSPRWYALISLENTTILLTNNNSTHQYRETSNETTTTTGEINVTGKLAASPETTPSETGSQKDTTTSSTYSSTLLETQSQKSVETGSQEYQSGKEHSRRITIIGTFLVIMLLSVSLYLMSKIK